MAFKRRYLPLSNKTSNDLDGNFQDINAALKYLQGQIVDLQKGSTIRRTYSVSKGLVRWHIVNEYGNGLVDCSGYMANPFWSAIEGDHPVSHIAIVRLPVTFINKDYVITYSSRTDEGRHRLGQHLCDYGNVFETSSYQITTSSFPVAICEDYTGFNYRVIGWT